MFTKTSSIQFFLLIQIFMCGLATIKANNPQAGVKSLANEMHFQPKQIKDLRISRARRSVWKGALIGAVAGAGAAYVAKKYMERKKENNLKNAQSSDFGRNH